MSYPAALGRALGTGLVTAIAAAVAAADYTVTGQVTYVDKQFTFNSGFTGVEPELPARFAAVRVVDANTDQTLASGETDALGQFDLDVGGTGTKDVFVRVIARSSAFGPTLRVTDDNQQNYVLDGPVFADHDQTLDLDAGTIVSPITIAAGREGNPFNLLDQMIDAMDWVVANGAGPLPQVLRVQWPSGPSSSSLNTVAFIADDDGYDDCVILHELGHVMHNVYSDNDQAGGAHTFGESNQEPKLAFGEGWASYFSSAVRELRGDPDPGFYLDAFGTGLTGPTSVQIRMRLEDAFPFATSTVGEADEGAIACCLWDLSDSDLTPGFGAGDDDDPVDGSFDFNGGLSGAELIWRSLDGPVETVSNSNIIDLWDGLFLPGLPGFDGELVDTFDFWGIRVAPDAFEPNDDIASATVLPISSTFGPLHTLYSPAPGTTAPGDGDSDFFRFTVEAGLGFEIETRYPDGLIDAGTWADPFVEIYRPDGTPFGSNDNGGIGRNVKFVGLADVTGDWLAEIKSVHPFRTTGSYEIRAKLTGLDCNNNGIADEVEISDGSALDLDQDGVPDVCQPFSADVGTVALATGSAQTFALDAGPGFAGSPYVILGSLSGTSPGFPLDNVVVPINVDDYTALTLSPASSPLIGAVGLFDVNGQATAQFDLPTGLPLTLLGVVAHHAYFAFGPTFTVDLASNPLQVVITLF